MARTKLRAARYQRGETQRELANTLGCTETAVYYWESARAKPHLGTARKLSEHFGVPIAELLEIETAATSDRR